MQASVSIHLMLLFISRQYQEAQYLLDVSIHLMLLFIQFLASYDELEISFNTSHVTLYLERASDFVDTMTLFQYISCYSLSKEGIDNMKDVRSFNTSHVTLYPLVLQAFLLLTVFIIQQNTKDCKIFTNRHLIFYLLNQNLVYPRIFNIFHFFVKIRLVIFITFHLTYLRNSPVMFSH